MKLVFKALIPSLDRSKEVTGVKYDENKSTIVTKQALTSNNAKSSKDGTLNPHQSTGNSDSKQESLVTISNQSPMEQLLQTESNIIHNKATAKEPASQKATETEAVKKSKDAALNNDIQSLSDHLKKVDDKLDMTAALEESDKRTIHPKVRGSKVFDAKGATWLDQSIYLKRVKKVENEVFHSFGQQPHFQFHILEDSAQS